MAEIPSHIASSAAQAGFQAREVAKEREARRAGSAEAANRQVKAVDEADTHVDTEDGDTAVFADSEGAGSQGRSLDEDADQEESNQTPEDAPDDNSDDENSGLDIEA